MIFSIKSLAIKQVHGFLKKKGKNYRQVFVTNRNLSAGKKSGFFFSPRIFGEYALQHLSLVQFQHVSVRVESMWIAQDSASTTRGGQRLGQQLQTAAHRAGEED